MRIRGLKSNLGNFDFITEAVGRYGVSGLVKALMEASKDYAVLSDLVYAFLVKRIRQQGVLISHRDGYIEYRHYPRMPVKTPRIALTYMLFDDIVSDVDGERLSLIMAGECDDIFIAKWRAKVDYGYIKVWIAIVGNKAVVDDDVNNILRSVGKSFRDFKWKLMEAEYSYAYNSITIEISDKDIY